MIIIETQCIIRIKVGRNRDKHFEKVNVFIKTHALWVTLITIMHIYLYQNSRYHLNEVRLYIKTKKFYRNNSELMYKNV